MAYLYLDTGNGLTLGVLDENYEWLTFKSIDTKKTSMIVHEEINDSLESLGYSLDQLSGLFISSGPGSYTGMRVAEGIAQIFELESIKVWSFHNFRIPDFLGLNDCTWCFPAFKGEVYLKGHTPELVKLEEFETLSHDLKLMTHGENEFSQKCQKNGLDLIKEQPASIFSKVVSMELRDKPFYFRPLDQEFTKSSK